MSLRLIANSDAAVTITVKVRNSSGVLVPYNISAATEISWILNKIRDDADPDTDQDGRRHQFHGYGQ